MKLIKCLWFSSTSETKKNIPTNSLKKILISNRGEIACRIIKTAKKLGIRTVAIFSTTDENALHTRTADEAYNIGAAASEDSYLSISKIIKIAKLSKCQAIHPGYGFLSESVDFAEACQKENIIFIGPSSAAIHSMGVKSISKLIMHKAGIPVIDGYHGKDQSDQALIFKACQIGFPLMIKAIRGGGGKGMRIVKKPECFMNALQSARLETRKSFGDCSVLLERFIDSPRHIEVQVLADCHGNFIHLFERDCSVQRRHQKIIEETPAPGISEHIRNELGKTAVKVAKAVDYTGAGTVEFIVDKNNFSFYFMEMNTRLQVEHPITEMITGLDLVEWQIKIASGDSLSSLRDKIKRTGHAFEARIYAENPRENFLPCAGPLKYMSPPKNCENVRVETGVEQGDEVSVFYDPMIAKLVVWGECRLQSLNCLLAKLIDFHVAGLETNINFLINLIMHTKFANGNVHTGFISENYEKLFENNMMDEGVLYKAGLTLFLNERATINANSSRNRISNNDPFIIFHSRINSVMIRRYFLKEFSEVNTVCIKMDRNKLSAKVNSTPWKEIKSETVREQERCKIKTKVNDCLSSFFGFIAEKEIAIFTEKGKNVLTISQPKYLLAQAVEHISNKLYACAPLSGVLESIHVRPGDRVKKGDSLAVIIAMKMEHILKSPVDATVKYVNAKKGNNINQGMTVVTFED